MKLRKISFPANYRNWFTLSDIDAVEALRKSILNDEGKVDLTWEAEHLLTLGSDNKMLPSDILTFEAEYAKNSNVEFDKYCDGSARMDVWITVNAFHVFHGFYQISGYLSDIWELGSDNRDEIRGRLYIKHYSEDK